MIESIIQVYLEVQKSTLFAHAVRNFILELPCTSVESYAWLYVKKAVYFIMRQGRESEATEAVFCL